MKPIKLKMLQVTVTQENIIDTKIAYNNKRCSDY